MHMFSRLFITSMHSSCCVSLIFVLIAVDVGLLINQLLLTSPCVDLLICVSITVPIRNQLF